MAQYASLLGAIAERVEDSDAEAFIAFSGDTASLGLGLVDGTAKSLETTIQGREFTLRQSPTVLKSNRAGGSTGAGVWQITLALADWLAWPKCPLLGAEGLIDASSTVAELGCGVSSILASVLAPRVETYIATDQEYVLKLFRENYDASLEATGPALAKGKKTGRAPDVRAVPLDWETDDPRHLNDGQGVDAVLVSDCIFNEALIQPLVETCEAICGIRQGASSARPTVCVVAQQLRSFEVFEMWLVLMMTRFEVYRVKREALTGQLKGEEGFIVHLAVLKDA